MTTGGSTFWTSGSVPLIEPEFLSSIIGAASDIALVVSAERIILSVVVNKTTASFGDLSHWEGRSVLDFLTVESIEKFEGAHRPYLEGKLPDRSLELNHCEAQAWQYPVRYTFHRFGYENAVLLLGRDLRPIAETQQQLVQAQIALEQGFETRREFDARYRVLMSQVPEPVVFVSTQSGRLEDANPAAAELFGMKVESLVGCQFHTLATERSGEELLETLVNATLNEDGARVTMRIKRSGEELQVNPTVFRARGQRILMCRLLGKTKGDAGTDATSVQAAALFRNSGDAICFTDPKGVIASVNDGFMDLVGAGHLGDLVGKSLGDFLARGQIDLGVLTDNAERGSQMRMYGTKVVNRLGSAVPVEISTTRIEDPNHPGIGLILRDTTRAASLRQGDTGSGSEANRKVVELVGSASLKEIVAQTTDVVEKMCIETAVALTKNNRVAAAEMLGLSRQSLYVKLRKFGLLDRP